MTNYETYPSYKDSGVEWLGKIPEAWNTVSLRWLSRRFSGGTPDKSVPRYWSDGTIPWLASGEVNQSIITEPTTYITDDAFRSSSAKWVPKGATLIALAGQGKTKGMAGLLKFDSTTNQSLAAVIPNYKLQSEYLFFFAKSAYWQLRGDAGEGKRDGLNLEILGDLKTPLPSPAEQTAIANFLDDKTAKIDKAIAQKEQLIALLKERKQIIIQNAVTKGLDPNVKMKPSGIEWIGEIPEHWEVEKVFHHFSAKKGKDAAELTKEYCDTISGVYPVYSGQTANGGIMGSIDRYEFDFSDSGCLFSTTVGAKAMTCRFLKGKFSLSQNCMIFSSRNARLDHEYFYYGFLPMFEFYRSIIPDHMQASFRMEDLYQYRFLKPPEDEQIAIKAHINSNEAGILKCVEKAESAIRTLREYRATLIDSAVTGKIKVPGV